MADSGAFLRGQERLDLTINYQLYGGGWGIMQGEDL